MTRRGAAALAVSAAFHAVSLVATIAFWPHPASPQVRTLPRDRTPRTSTRSATPEHRRYAEVDRERDDSSDGVIPRSVVQRDPGRRLARTDVRAEEGPTRAFAPVGSGRSLASSGLLDHLWQSTLFTFVVGLVTLAFRRSEARVRYWLWFATSVKFLIPFSLLVALGGAIPGVGRVESISTPAVSIAVSQVSRPFAARAASEAALGVPAASCVDWIRAATILLWVCGFELLVLMRFRAWRTVRHAVRVSTPMSIRGVVAPPGIEIRSTRGVLEPGVVGFWRPVLLLPAGIEEHLGAAELQAVAAHELHHIQCRDNLTAALHMAVECVCWFHPLVWWIGARLIQERERACDEHVLRSYGDPRAYADGIVNVCKRYVDARLACVPGVGSSDLRRRIERIMKNETGEATARWKKISLAVATCAMLVAPVAFGAANAPLRTQAPAQFAAAPASAVAFQAASVKLNVSGDIGARFDPQQPGRFTATNVTAALLIRFAYDLPDFQVNGGPGWLNSDRFDVIATAEGNPSTDQKRLMLRRLLADRFKLTVHSEPRELPIYALRMVRSDGRLGSGLRRSSENCTASGSALFPGLRVGPDGPPNAEPPRCGFFGMAPGTNLPAARGGLAFRGLTMDGLAKTLVTVVRRNVVDETRLAGYFDGDIDFLAELPPPPPPPGVPNPFTTPFVSVFTALPEQLGLKLDSARGTVDVLVIDGAEHPAQD